MKKQSIIYLAVFLVLCLVGTALALNIDADSNDAVDVGFGGTNATSAAAALTNLGAESETHATEHNNGGNDELTIDPSQIPCNEGEMMVGTAGNVGDCVSETPNLATTVMPSTDNTWSGLAYTANAGEAIVQWEVVYFDYTDNEWKPADADAAGEWPAWGVATAAGTDGNALVVLYRGCFQSTATTPVFLSIWSDGEKLFLSDTADDTDCADDDCYGWTDTAPSTSTDCVQPLGHVIDTGSAAYICVDFSHIHGWATVP